MRRGANVGPSKWRALREKKAPQPPLRRARANAVSVMEGGPPLSFAGEQKGGSQVHLRVLTRMGGEGGTYEGGMRGAIHNLAALQA